MTGDEEAALIPTQFSTWLFTNATLTVVSRRDAVPKGTGDKRNHCALESWFLALLSNAFVHAISEPDILRSKKVRLVSSHASPDPPTIRIGSLLTRVHVPGV